MQSNDWLATLMSGLGGAFTGVGVARDRRATDAQREAEMQMRQRQATMTDAIQGASLEGQMGQLGYRREMPAPRPVAGGAGVMGAAGNAATNAMEGMRRGPTRETPIGTFQLDRMATPDARAMQANAMQANAARAELERRAREKEEERAFTASENEKNRGVQRAAIEARNLGGTGGGAPTNPIMGLPPVERRNVIGNVQKMSVIDAAIEELGQYPDAVGPKRGMTPGWLRDRNVPMVGDPQGVMPRALMANLSSLEIRDRSGAAVTAAEFPRLQPFIPSVGDDYETVIKKLQGMKRVIAEENLVMGQAYGVDLSGLMPDDNAGRASGTAGRRTPGTTGAFGNSGGFNLPFPD